MNISIRLQNIFFLPCGGLKFVYWFFFFQFCEGLATTKWMECLKCCLCIHFICAVQIIIIIIIFRVCVFFVVHITSFHWNVMLPHIHFRCRLFSSSHPNIKNFFLLITNAGKNLLVLLTISLLMNVVYWCLFCLHVWMLCVLCVRCRRIVYVLYLFCRSLVLMRLQYSFVTFLSIESPLFNQCLLLLHLFKLCRHSSFFLLFSPIAEKCWHNYTTHIHTSPLTCTQVSRAILISLQLKRRKKACRFLYIVQNETELNE